MLLLAPGTFTLFGGIPPDWGAPAFPRSLAAVLAVHCLTDRPTWRRVLLSLCLIVFAPRLDRACLDWWRVSRGGLARVLFVCAACSQVLGHVASFNNKKKEKKKKKMLRPQPAKPPTTTSLYSFNNNHQPRQNRQHQQSPKAETATSTTTATTLTTNNSDNSMPRPLGGGLSGLQTRQRHLQHLSRQAFWQAWSSERTALWGTFEWLSEAAAGASTPLSCCAKLGLKLKTYTETGLLAVLV